MNKNQWRAAWRAFRTGEPSGSFCRREYIALRKVSLLRLRYDEVFRGGIMCPFRRLASVKSLGRYGFLTKIELP